MWIYDCAKIQSLIKEKSGTVEIWHWIISTAEASEKRLTFLGDSLPVAAEEIPALLSVKNPSS